MRYLAAAAAGFGGLLVELAAVRRVGLLLGNTTEAAACVLGVFLLGIGLGGLWVARSPRLLRGSNRAAAALYGSVAVLVCVGDFILRGLDPVGWFAGLGMLIVQPGLAACAMGMAFPLLFGDGNVDGGGRHRAGGLVAANLIGSVAACALGGNFLVPVLGLTLSHWIGASAYAVAAVAMLAAGRGVATAAAPVGVRPAGDGAAPALRPALRAAALAGFGTIAFEVLLLRRLTFFLEGFQPTLSGVLAVCLAALAAGAAFGTPMLRRLGSPERVAGVAIVCAGIVCCVALHEWVGPGLSKLEVSTDFGFHGRVWLVAAISASPACFLFGAVVPLAIEQAAASGADRAAVAGRLFCAQGVGALAGALAANSLVPWIAPASYYVALPMFIGLSIVVGVGSEVRPALRLTAVLMVCLSGALGFAGPGRPWYPTPPVVSSRFDRPDRFVYLAHRTDSTVSASVVYDRAKHSMTLFTNEFRAAYTGPDTAYMKVLGHLPFLLRRELRDVAVIALGTGTTADAVCGWPEPEAVHVVEISPAVLSLVDWFAGDGPVRAKLRPRFLADSRTRVHIADGRRWLASQPDRSLDLVTMEPMLPYAPGTAPLYSSEFYASARDKLRERGLFVQWVPTHSMPAEFFATLLGTFGCAFEHTSVWLVDQSTLLVGSDQSHLLAPGELDRAFDDLPNGVRRQLHEAGIASGVDLEVAHIGTALRDRFGDGDVLTDERPFLERIGYWSGEQRLAFYPTNLGQLQLLIDDAGLGGPVAATVRRDRLAGLIDRSRGAAALAVRSLATARARRPTSVLLHGEETMAWRLERERRARSGDQRVAASLASRHLTRDAGSALLQACVAFGEGADQAAAVRAALAIDPTVFDAAYNQPLLGSIAPHEGRRRSPLEDLSVLPEAADDLVEMACRDDGRAFAVRAAYPVRCALAAVDVARRQPVERVARLRAAFDPASFDEFARAVASREGGELIGEVGTLWRSDLPMPSAFDGLVGASKSTERVRFAALLGGHRGPRALHAIAALLVDADVTVRDAAGAALFRSVGDAVQYDPTWPESRRSRAAAEVRRLHNRRR